MINDPTEEVCLTEMGPDGGRKGTRKWRGLLICLVDSEKTKTLEMNTQPVKIISKVVEGRGNIVVSFDS